MPAWVRKFVVMVAIAVIAAAGIAAPQLAYASSHSAPIAAGAEHDHDTGHVQASGTTATTPCDEHGPLHGKGKPDHPCCAAACAGMAFVATVADLSYPPPVIERWMPVREMFRPAPTASIERPPRTI